MSVVIEWKKYRKKKHKHRNSKNVNKAHFPSIFVNSQLSKMSPRSRSILNCNNRHPRRLNKSLISSYTEITIFKWKQGEVIQKNIKLSTIIALPKQKAAIESRQGTSFLLALSLSLKSSYEDLGRSIRKQNIQEATE